MTSGTPPVHYRDDARQVARLLAGDERAFREFFQDHYQRLYRFALARLNHDVGAAEDVAQLTLSKALRKLASYRGESQLFTWLCAICRTEIADAARKQARYRTRVVLTEDHPELRAAVETIEAPEGPLEFEMERVEVLRLITAVLDRLPPRYGDALEWKYIEGYSAEEIAARLDIGLDAANSLLARAKRAFKDVYSELAAAVLTIAPGGKAT
jgi:RNA polymerase sigma-70 factor (ECF subfamily)